MTWNLSAKKCLEKSNDNPLIEVVNKEINRWNIFLFNILSITYDPGSITKIRDNLEFGSLESISYAHEIIDIVIDDSIKQKLISLLDVVPDEEKLRNLNQFFPVETPLYNKLLEDILNREYNLLSIWTKACVLRYMSGIEGDEMAESVVALLFSPEILLQEEAARLINRSNRKLYGSVYTRIPETARKHLDLIINGATEEKEFLFEKIQFLSNCFSGIPEEELLPLAGTMIYANDLKTILSSFPDGYICWSLSANADFSEVHIFYSGEEGIRLQNLYGNNNTSFYILPLSAVEEYHYQFPENAYTILKYIDCNEK